jgi:hypothetical protein
LIHRIISFALLTGKEAFPHADEVDSHAESYEEEWHAGVQDYLQASCLVKQLPRSRFMQAITTDISPERIPMTAL